MRIGVLLSGRGTNLQAIIDAIARGALDAQIALVISSTPEADGLRRAREAQIATISLAREVYRSPEAADELIAAEMKQAEVEYIVMAGYMRLLTDPVLAAFPDRVLNIHPALLPSFPGAHGIADAYHAGVKLTGVTVHFANAAYDRGPIIAQRAVPIEEDDSLETLETRIHELEHVLYPEVLQLIAEGRVSIDAQRRVHVAAK
ncbi:MAG: phosphoribosylglycinamide formyltransferase [Coriobacteriales bacterium]|jgi:phosphoribosylglycinamide formyltransferase-1|nr:phosphoribosylglycinamide formyltransferase [Coriobacteriales bacterium]